MKLRRSIPVFLSAAAMVVGGCTTGQQLTVDHGGQTIDPAPDRMIPASIAPTFFSLGAGDALGMELGRVYLVQHRIEREGVHIAVPTTGRGFLD